MTNLWRGPRVLALLERLDVRSASLVRVLVHDDPGDAEGFERRIELLGRRYPIVSAAQVVDASEGGRPLPPRAVLLVFRRLEGFVERAWPSLERRGLAAALFLAPESAGDSLAARAAELRLLAQRGLTLGLSGTGWRAPDRAPSACLARFLDELARVQPDTPRLFLHRDARPSAEELAAVCAARVDLAFTTRAGTIDLRWSDPLRLRSLAVDARAPLAAFRAQLVLASPRWRQLGGAVEPDTDEERRFERRARARRRRLRFRARPLDALLTAGARPRSFAATLRALFRVRSSNYDRVRNLAGLATGAAPPLARWLRRALLDTSQLPLVVDAVELEAHGSAATVFRLVRHGRPTHALKVYRWTLDQPAASAHAIVRRQRARHLLLRQWFGECALSTHFLLLRGPLRGLPAAASLQPYVARSRDLLARTDEELLALLRERPALAREFAAFARRALEVRALGFFPDVLGSGNLLLEEHAGGAHIRLVDCDGLYDLRVRWPGLPTEALAACAHRFERLLGALEPERVCP